MNISQAAKLSGLPSETIRYYEKIDLLINVKRSANGYRDYDAKDVALLSFLQHARTTGFSLDECRHLLDLYGDDKRQSVHVKQMVENKLVDIEKQIASLQSMKSTLRNLADGCRGDETPHCHILDVLAEPYSISSIQKEKTQ
jgi:Cu(I)-responsive transcriptional regulator